MRCTYCFYKDVAGQRRQASLGMMEERTAKSLVDAAFCAVEPGGAVTFAFQGGEPTLAGLDYFESFTRLVQEKRPPRVRVQYAVQTNGMLLDENWARFFKAHGFLVGLSLDGRKNVHDLLRVDTQGKGSWNRVLKALELLQKYDVMVNLLCVVSRQVARRPQAVYTALKKLGAGYLQFIPCLDPLGEERGGQAHSLTPEDYGDFLCGLFDVWYADWARGQHVSVRLFEDYARLFMGLAPGTCATTGSCGGYFVVEGDGGLYPCDFYVLDEWRLGNVNDDALNEIMAGSLWGRFLREKLSRPAACGACEWRMVCGGGCKRDWTGSPERHNYYCPAFKAFFAHAGQRLRGMGRGMGRANA